MALKMIAAVDQNGGLGYKNELLFHIKEDLQRFKELTTSYNSIVLMGRKTYESIIEMRGKHLEGRTNVVLTGNKEYKTLPEVLKIDSVEKVVNHYTKTGEQDKDVWIIGGQTLYEQFLPYVDEVHLTLVHKKAEKVDTYFPMDKLHECFEEDYRLVNYSPKYECEFHFITYKNKLKENESATADENN